MEQFYIAVKKHADDVALRVERNGQWVSWTWTAYRRDVELAARALIKLGLKPHESVCIIGFNSPEWFFANMGAIAAGGKAAGIYTTNEPEACHYIAEHSDARVAVVENEAQLDKFLAIRDRLPKLAAIVVNSGAVPDKVRAGNAAARVKVYDWAEFLALASGTPEKELQRRIEDQRPGHGCTLIYTSGTTGHPKAVMVSHDNLTWTAQSLFQIMPPGFGNKEEHVVSYLPLSHIAAQMVDIHLPIGIAATYSANATVHFARPDALKGTLGDTLKACRPTVFFGVPRVWEKIAEKMKALGASTTGLKKSLVTWAKSCGTAAFLAEQYTGDLQLPWGFPLANRLVLSKVRQALGLDRCSMCLTGAAPISADTLNYFGALYIPIYELYGMSECCGPMTVSAPGTFKVGSCGPAMPGCEIKIDHDPARDQPGQGEIVYRGRHIMLGYMKDEAKSREAIDADGWLHSGDVGRIDKDGFLYITGRIKELIITAGGENIAPVPMEDAIKSKLPGLSNVMMIGDKRKFNVCIVTLRLKQRDDGSFTDELVGESLNIGSPAKTVQEAQKCEIWKKYITAGITAANKTAVSNASRIQKFRIVGTDFSVPGGELTATLKLRRTPTCAKFADVIEAMYAEAGGD
jgi:long-chain-fatty-acid--CoA ligase ACSBG